MSLLNAFLSAFKDRYPDDPKECLAIFKTGDIGSGRRSQRQYQLAKRAMKGGLKEAQICFLRAFVWETANLDIATEVRQMLDQGLAEDDHELKLLYAEFLVNGWGSVGKDAAKGWQIYQGLAEKGSASAAYEVGLKSLKESNYPKAILLLKQADLSDFRVNDALGDAYMRGWSITSRGEQDFIDYFTTGFFGLGYESRDKPTEDDVRMALQCYRNAINFHPPGVVHPNISALYAAADCIRILGFENQGLIYEHINNLVRASEHDHFRSTFELACLYHRGELVPKNTNFAKKYAQTAIRIHSKTAGNPLAAWGAESARRVVAIRHLKEILTS
jgi:TPR repeat protein